MEVSLPVFGDGDAVWFLSFDVDSFEETTTITRPASGLRTVVVRGNWTLDPDGYADLPDAMRFDPSVGDDEIEAWNDILHPGRQLPP